MFRSLRSIIAVLVASLSFAVFAADVEVADPYARAVPPGQPNSAVFMTLSNPSQQDRVLVGAESSVAETVELHTHIQADGMMQMRRIERIDLPAGQSVELAPGGLHVMLIGLQHPLDPEATIDLTLVFDDGDRMALKVPVRRIEMGQMRHSNMAH
ncbi:copper chaperone PCu(A)C [Thiorhodococcus fuscus]|uniref:Copper chaperone PCu(A)C n=1 Tax=Thiorhodococcus fuscus TaxID=527200 RepID=A0ABW4Y9V3_9GAMM